MKSKKQEVSSFDDVELELVKSGRLKEKKDGNYVNNKQVYEEFVKYNELKKKWKAEGKEGNPPMRSDIIGRAIIQIATRRCNSWHVVRRCSQDWKEDFISKAILIATVRCVSFDPDNYDNPFAYLTQIVNNAILEQLKLERRELYVKYKTMDQMHGFYGELDDDMDEADFFNEDLSNDAYQQRKNFIERYEENNLKNKEKMRQKREEQQSNEKEGILKFLDE